MTSDYTYWNPWIAIAFGALAGWNFSQHWFVCGAALTVACVLSIVDYARSASE